MNGETWLSHHYKTSDYFHFFLLVFIHLYLFIVAIKLTIPYYIVFTFY